MGRGAFDDQMSSGYQCSHFVGDVTFVVAEIRPPEFGQSQYAKFLPGAVARQRPPVHLSIQLAKENHKGFSTISRKQKKRKEIATYSSPSDAGTGGSLSLAGHLDVIVYLVLVYGFGSSHECRRFSDQHFHDGRRAGSSVHVVRRASITPLIFLRHLNKTHF